MLMPLPSLIFAGRLLCFCDPLMKLIVLFCSIHMLNWKFLVCFHLHLTEHCIFATVHMSDSAIASYSLYVVFFSALSTMLIAHFCLTNASLQICPFYASIPPDQLLYVLRWLFSACEDPTHYLWIGMPWSNDGKLLLMLLLVLLIMNGGLFHVLDEDDLEVDKSCVAVGVN